MRVRRVSAFVLVRCASFTALAQGPSASKRHKSPSRSMLCPEALNTYCEPAGAMPMRNGARARSRSTTLMGSPLCRDTALHASTAVLMEPSEPSPEARTRYSEAGLPRPVGL